MRQISGAERYEKLAARGKLVGVSLVPMETIQSPLLFQSYLDTQEEKIDKIFKEKCVFPTRAVIKGDCNRRIIHSKWGLDTKYKFRTMAKQIPLYGEKIICPIMGEAFNTKIPINNIGRWVFGTPGYKSNIRFRQTPDTDIYEIQWGLDAPAIVTELIDLIIIKWEETEGFGV